MVSSQWPVHAVPGKTPPEGKKRVLECWWGLPAPAYHQGPEAWGTSPQGEGPSGSSGRREVEVRGAVGAGVA
ncbi:hypothetical protein PI124_g6991 [Phytophthora idaei]|nr:hypothetical protein PI125_g6652 [Phytophthora idaei]KAG3161550.1 hypothetical protein PI126_g6389 [Phytophthora idaei]KAG3248323.1 hypothetical protein PI124_g6991 [Phytophthora idaei]